MCDIKEDISFTVYVRYSLFSAVSVLRSHLLCLFLGSMKTKVRGDIYVCVCVNCVYARRRRNGNKFIGARGVDDNHT